IKNLDLNLAARYDDYSDVGSTTNWKANVRWQPTQQLLLRGSYGTGFRAPTLTDLWNPVVLGTSSEFNDPVTGQQSLQVNEFSGGNSKLAPETSKQYSLGLVFQPLPTLAIGLDYFNIEVNDTIAEPSTQEIVSQAALGNPLYTGLVKRDPLTNEIIETTAQLQNNGTLQAQGIDFDVRYREKLGPGLLGIGLNSTYYLKYDQSTPGGSSAKIGTIINPDGSPVISSTAGLNVGVILRYKQYLSANWTQGDWSTTLGNSYATGYWGGRDLNDNDTKVDPLSLWDLQVSYSGFKNAVITLGANNILDTGPSIFVPAAQQFMAGYDPTQYDPRGRFVYLTGTFKF
ncbi:MAG: TonB-dependent receptor domain-containing protein, partial [Rubrivivax sp.]